MHIRVVVSPRVLVAGSPLGSAGAFHFGNVYLSVSTAAQSDYDIVRTTPVSPFVAQ